MDLREIKQLIEQNGDAVKAMKNKQDARIAALEDAVNAVQTDQEKAWLGGGGGNRHDSEYRSMLMQYLQTGDDRMIRDLNPQGRMSFADDTQGGVLLDDQTSRDIYAALADEVAVRGLASVGTMRGASWRKVVRTDNPTAVLSAPGASRPDSGDAEYGWMTYNAKTMYSSVSLDVELLEDSIADLAQDIVQGMTDDFAALEDQQFILGENEPNELGGIIGGYDIVANASYEWGKLGYIATGDASGFPAADPGDVILNLIYALPMRFHRRAAFIMNRATFATISKFKDGQDNYLFTPLWSEGKQSMTIRGYPVRISDSMPDIGAGEFAIAFGDFSRGYLIRDRQGIRVLRDPYSTKGALTLYTTRRVAAGVQDFGAIKLLKCAAS